MILLRGRYELENALGEGAFGRTFRAIDAHTAQPVAVKELTIKGLPDWKPVDQFEREVKVLRSLDHPTIPKLVDAFEETVEGRTRLFLVTEFIPGPTLAQAITDGRRWDASQARALLQSLLQTLAYLHGLSPPVVHRDVKPGNIILRTDGSPSLIDFGAVRDLAGRHSDGNVTVMGTPGYMAPEQALGSADARSDLYGLGATLVHALTHENPSQLPREGMRLRFGHLVGVPKALVRILQSMLEPDPAKRLSSAQEGLDILDHPPPEDEETAQTAVRVTASDPDPPTGTDIALRAPQPLAGLVPSTTPRPSTRALDRHFAMPTLARYMPVYGVMGIVATMAAVLAVALLSAGKIGVSLLVGLPVLITIIGGLRAGRRAVEANEAQYRTGTLVEGELLAATRSRMGMTVHYEYQVAGAWYSGKVITLDAALTNAITAGTRIAVFYEPKRPKRHFALLEPEFGKLPAVDPQDPHANEN